jgi:glycosyltransferase involved in cell wall biosynthesis
VAVSGRTAAEIADAFPDLRGRVTVIPHGLRRLPAPRGERSHILAFGGGGDRRKRVDLMVATYRSYRQSARHPLPLVVLARAGLTEGQRRELVTLGARLIEQASAAEVDALVAAAAAVVYPTANEGFGLPILEAGEMGTPVVMSRTADVATEVVGRHCRLVAGTDAGTWSAALRQAIADGPVDDPLDLPDWTEVARRYTELYRQVAH